MGLPVGFVRQANLSNVVVMPGTPPTAAASPAHALRMRAAESIGTSALALAPDEVAHVHEHVHVETAARVERSIAALRMEAKMKGYEGESCSECGNFTMVRNGTCLKCDSCGGTSGCS